MFSRKSFSTKSFSMRSWYMSALDSAVTFVVRLWSKLALSVFLKSRL